ncbi:MAG: prephenate dehydrogenase [Ichthyobacteriaceae bacterium]|nr:prephenate dehydrogenase [Ichthyobacteriaceae bacterium]
MSSVAIIGLGLIGGSLAKDFRHANQFKYFIGVENNTEHANKALEIGLVDEILNLDDAITKADFIILAIPVTSAKNIASKLLDKLKNQTLIDVGSTKEGILLELENHPKRSQFVATHPMAGTEFSGPEAAIGNLFNNKAIIICDADKSDIDRVEKVEQIYKSIGGDIEYMSGKEHDISAAYVSHISHITSFALALTVLNKEKSAKNITTLASGGFRSTVRLAKSNKDTWEAIFSENKDNVLEVLDNYIESITLFKHAIKSGNAEVVKTLISQANEVKKVL